MKHLKRFLVALVAIPILAAASALVAISTMDPNNLKTVLTKTAAQHNMALQFNGALSWQFYPTFGISVEGLSIGATTQTSNATAATQPLLNIRKAQANVKLLPLIKRNIEVTGFYLEDVNALYTIDINGKTPWDNILQNTHTQINSNDQRSNAKDTTQPNATVQAPQLHIENIHLKNVALTYSNAKDKTQTVFRNINLNITHFNWNNTPFDTHITLFAKINHLPEFAINYSGTTQLDLSNNTLHAPNSTLTLHAQNQTAHINFNAHTQWSEAFAAQGTLTLKEAPLRSWLTIFSSPIHTNSPSALTRLNLQTAYRASGEHIQLKNIKGQLDGTAFTGNAQVNNWSKPEIHTQWTLGNINLDDYLPPNNKQPEHTSHNTPATPLPLVPLKALNLNAHIAVDSINTKQLTFKNTELTINAKNGLVRISPLKAQLSDGDIQLNSTLDARTKTAKISADIKATNIPLEPLLQTFSNTGASTNTKANSITGQFSTQAKLNTHGKTDKDVFNNLTLDAQVQSQALRLTPINLEKTYCQAVALLQQKTLPTYNWPLKTNMEPVTVNIQMQGHNINLNALNAHIAKLSGAASGTYNLETGEFNVPIRLSLGDFADGIEGCLPIPQKWRKRQLPIRCKGTLNTLGIKTCLPDTKLLEAVLKEKAHKKVEEQKDKLEETLKTKAQELLDKNIKEEHKDIVENKLKDLLKGLKK